MSNLNSLNNTTEQLGELEQSLFDAELSKSELKYLRYQVKLLEDLLAEQSQELAASNEDLAAFNEEIELLEKEILQLLAEKRLTLKEATEFANDLLAKRLPIREALAQLLYEIYGEAIALKEFVETPKLLDHNPSFAQSAFLSAATKTFIAQQIFSLPSIELKISELKTLVVSKTKQTRSPESLSTQPLPTRVKFTNLAEQGRIVQEVIATSKQLSASLRKSNTQHKKVMAKSKTLVTHSSSEGNSLQ